MLAIIFAVLVPVWIPLDIYVFPRAVWDPLTAGRVASSIGFALLARYGCRTSTNGHVRLALAILFLIPSVFFLYSHAVLWNSPLSRDGAILASGYAFGFSVTNVLSSRLAVDDHRAVHAGA